MALLAAVISLKPTRALPEFLGRAAQAWFLDTVRQSDPALARALHDKGGQDRRPYTVTVMIRQADSEAVPYLRLTSFSPELTSHLEQVFLPGLQASLTLAGVEIGITKVATTRTAHPWAAHSDYEALARETFDRAAQELSQGLKPRVRLRFETPTAFRHNGILLPLPLPELVYGSLIRAWDSFSPLNLPVQMGDFLAQSVAVARHRIATHRVRMGGEEKYIGFTGSVEYAILPATMAQSEDAFRQRVQAIALLSEFAFYAGVGIRTAVGMGQLRPDHDEQS